MGSRAFGQLPETGFTQLGADCIDFGGGDDFPGVKEQGYPDLDELLKIRKRIRSLGLDINRVTLPDITERFMKGMPGGDKELENTCNALKVFGEAGVPIVRQRFAGDTFNEIMTRYPSKHRGGYISRGESRTLTKNPPETPTLEELQEWWKRFCEVYGELVPIAEDYDVKLAIHPSDTPNPDTPLGGLGFHRVIDTFPSRNVGYLLRNRHHVLRFSFHASFLGSLTYNINPQPISNSKVATPKTGR